MDSLTGGRNSVEASESKPILTFAVIADTHVNSHDNFSVSPWESNARANARARWVISELNRQKPAFVVHVGDFVHPVPSLKSFAEAATSFQTLFEDVESDLYLVPGNHDVGDKPVAWMPAGTVTEDNLRQYRDYFGEDFYSFERQDILFLVINCQLINSGLPSEERQRNWLENELAASRAKRIFLFTHYPPFICRPEESGHYDNLDEPGRSWLLELIKSHKIEAVFAGHVHNYFFNRIEETLMYALPSTAFVRHDYSELARVGPDDEFGRSDVAKLGYMIVDVYDQDHSVTVVRTYGQELEPGKSPPGEAKSIRPLDLHKDTGCPLAVDLRIDWSEISQLPYNGALDEFVRKEARNDYPLLALREMGIRNLRIPVSDLMDDVKRARMSDLIALGHRFLVFQFGVPTEEELSFLETQAGLFASMEIVTASLEPEDLEMLPVVRERLQVPMYLSWLRTSANSSNDQSNKYYHFITHGFLPSEKELVDGLVSTLPPHSVDGIVFRVGSSLDVPTSLRQIESVVGKLDLKAMAHVRLSLDNPAEAPSTSFECMNRAVQAAVVAASCHQTQVCLDTFVDVDRGYFPRDGLLDRRFNLRDSGKILTNVSSLLAQQGDIVQSKINDIAAGISIVALGHGSGFCAILPSEEYAAETIQEVLPSDVDLSELSLVKLIDGKIIADGIAVDALRDQLPDRVDYPLAIVFKR